MQPLFIASQRRASRAFALAGLIALSFSSSDAQLERRYAEPTASAKALAAPGPIAGSSASSTSCTLGWVPTFGGEPGPHWTVHALAEFDDGQGPALYAGGDFTFAGGVATNHVARWDGESWSALGGGFDGPVNALAVYDDGGGPALYAGGAFHTAGGEPAQGIARWDGSAWSALGEGVNGVVSALKAFQSGGSGRPVLYAGGHFDAAGGMPASNVASWDGSVWAALGSGTDDWVSAFELFDDGTGLALYAAGYFDTAGSLPAHAIARWDGESWSSLPGGPSLYVSNALAVFDDGQGPALYVGLGPGVVRWDGKSWSSIGSGVGYYIDALTTYDDGSGLALYAGGQSFGKWDGTSWSPIEIGGLQPQALAVFDDGEGSALYAAGYSASLARVVKYNGVDWSLLGSGMDGSVSALSVFDDGGGPRLYAGGTFAHAGDVPASRIARWDGTGWSPLGSGVTTDSPWAIPYLSALAVFDDGGGPGLYAGGSFTEAGGVPASSIARWDGSSWSALPGVVATVSALAVYDDGSGPALYAAGGFIFPGSGDLERVVKWDGSTWSTVVTGLDGGGGWPADATAFAVFDDGAGPALYIGGLFFDPGGSPYYLGKWNGSSWSPLGSGMYGPIGALAVFDDGGGPALYAGGGQVAKWEGGQWAALGSGIGGPAPRVYALTVLDDGGGQALYVGGFFETAGGVSSRNIAKWDGAGWSALGSGMSMYDTVVSDDVRALVPFDAGGGVALYAGGSFASALDSGDSYIARWGCPPPVAEVPGCFGNPAALSAVSSVASAGQPFIVQFTADAPLSGVASLIFGLDGTSPAGCGVLVPGIGEILVALVPAPHPIGSEPIQDGVAAFTIPVPADPLLVGVKILLQGGGLIPALAPPIEVSTGLAVRIVP